MTIAEKSQIAKAVTASLLSPLLARTVVVAYHDERTVKDHGTGTLFTIEDEYLLITAAHVFEKYPVQGLQVIGGGAPSTVRVSVETGDKFGGRDQELDVGFLRLPEASVRFLKQNGKRFIGLTDLEVFPIGAGNDLLFAFGMPEAHHSLEGENTHRFSGFPYSGVTIPGDSNAASQKEVVFQVDYPEEVDDIITGKRIPLPKPFGMSGGAIWRANIAKNPIWQPTQLKMIGIMTEFVASSEIIKVNRIEHLIRLLALHYRSADEYLLAAESP